MSRTVVLKTLEKMSKEELIETSKLTMREIIVNFETIASSYDLEIDIECEEMKNFFQPITTADGRIIYVAKTKYIALCSDGLLAFLIEEIINYQKETWADVTCLMKDEPWYLEGKEQRQFKNSNGEIEFRERKLRIEIPAKKKGLKMFFFDDMD